MVSVYLNPPQDQGYLDSFYYMGGGDPTSRMYKDVGTKNSNSSSSSSSMAFGSGLEEPNKKVRKPYTITKSRENWSEQEHDKFLEALQLFDRDWKKIEAFVGSKSVIQIRSHAQKYFLKVQKNGASEHVPPPRPKRKAAHPYPQKAPKTVMSSATQPLQPSATLLNDSGYVVRPDSLPIKRNPLISSTTSSWNNHIASPAVSSLHIPKVSPDFAQVYSFIGSVFDPSVSDHLQMLKKMDPINVETILMLMKNLSVNLASSESDDHKRLISSYTTGRIEKESAPSSIS